MNGNKRTVMVSYTEKRRKQKYFEIRVSRFSIKVNSTGGYQFMVYLQTPICSKWVTCINVDGKSKLQY